MIKRIIQIGTVLENRNKKQDRIMSNENLDEQSIQNVFDVLKNGSTDEKYEVINALYSEELDDEKVSALAALMNDEDKGIRNSVTMLMLATQHPDFPKHVVEYVTSKDISVRNLAGEILIKFGSASVDAIIQFDHKNDDDNLKFIIDVLGLIGDQRSALFIMGILSGSENDNVILACIEALGNLRYEGSVDVLLLFYDRNELYKPTLVEALGKIGSKEALNFLVSKFTIEDELTQYSILESLGNLGDIETFFFLLEQVNTIGGPLVLPLITSISTLKDRYNLDIPFDNRMKSLLMYTIKEGTLDQKKVAFNLIESFDDNDILFTCLNLVGQDYELDETIKSRIFRNTEYIYRELARVINSGPKNLRQILNLFLQTIAYISEFQIEVNVTMLELRGITQALSGLLNNPDEEVRRSAMELLFNMDAETAFMFIDSMTQDENMWNRLRLVEMLEKFASDRIETALQKLIQDEDEMVRDRALFVYNSRINNVSETTN
jgi:HEAT repeat protein